VSQLSEFYRKYYRPENALLVIVGDFKTAEMRAQVERSFGAWQGAAPAAAADPSLPEIHGRRVHLVHLPGAVQAQITVGNRAITRKSPDWQRATLANAIYGGAFHSRLVLNIREQKGYTYSPRSGLHALRQHGYFSIHAAVRAEVVAATLAEMFYELDRMRALPVSEDELADARNYLSGTFSLGLGTQDGIAGQLGSVLLEEMPDDYLETYRARIQALTCSKPRGDISIPRTRKLSWSAIALTSNRKPRCSARWTLWTRTGRASSADQRARRHAHTSRERTEGTAMVRCARRVCLLMIAAALFCASVAHAAKQPPSKPLNLNIATADQLAQLPGIGPKTAQAIVDFRKNSGPFHRVEDLLAIRGISRRKLEAMRPYLTVGTPSP
jgi:competence ComEA-like helix-hairpin-helix protein